MKRKFHALILILSTCFFLLTGCSWSQTQEAIPTPVTDQLLSFNTHIDLVDDLKVSVRFSAHNGGEAWKDGTEINAYWRIIAPDGQVSHHGFVPTIPSGASGVNISLDQWEGFLQTGEYTIAWGAPGYGSTLDTFLLSQGEEGQAKISKLTSFMSPYFPPQADPKAQQ